jgi:HAD superfamily hydrolase (TIGR01509 family)
LLAPGLCEDKIRAIAAAKKEHYKKYVHLTEKSDVLVEFLKEMALYNKVVLVTTAKRQNAELVLKTHGILEYFSDMVFGDEVTNSKPHPEAYLKALEKTGLGPHEVLAFEDSPSGIASAESAGIRVVHIRSFT